jgi:outer membrane biogenesis lipoprotein LolB
MMHKKISFFFSALLICAFLIGCSSTAVEPAVVEAEEDVSTQISIVDGLGR